MTEIRVPGLGESVSEATVATWFVKPGEMVVADAMLCELETDKVTVEVRAPSAGVLSEVVVKEGETVAVNALLAVLLSAGAMPPAQPKSEGPAAPQKAAPTVQEVKMTDVMVPALGESVAEATVSTWFKKPGDAVAQDEILCELETDKVSVEVPAPVAGVLSEILAPEGVSVAAGGRLAILTAGAAATAAP
ncbi:biotin/lipoyl-containing protein, partial [Rhodobacter capsulatus]